MCEELEVPEAWQLLTSIEQLLYSIEQLLTSIEELQSEDSESLGVSFLGDVGLGYAQCAGQNMSKCLWNIIKILNGIVNKYMSDFPVMFSSQIQ